MKKVTDFKSLVGEVVGIIDLLIPLVIALIVVIWFWRLIDAWIINSGNQEKVAEGKRVALIGIIVLVIIFCIWGILRLLRGSIFGI